MTSTPRRNKKKNRRTETLNQNTHAFAHPSAILDSIRKFVADFGNNINRRNTIIVAEMVSLGHRLVRIDIEFALVRLRRVEEHIQVMRRIGLLGEPNSHRWPPYNNLKHGSADEFALPRDRA